MQTTQSKLQEEWVNVLTKGIITIPKKMREQVGMKEGSIAKVKVEGNKIIIEPKTDISFDEVRTFSEKELKEWIKADQLPEGSAKKTHEYWENMP